MCASGVNSIVCDQNVGFLDFQSLCGLSFKSPEPPTALRISGLFGSSSIIKSLDPYNYSAIHIQIMSNAVSNRT